MSSIFSTSWFGVGTHGTSFPASPSTGSNGLVVCCADGHADVTSRQTRVRATPRRTRLNIDLLRFDPQDGTFLFVRDHVEQAVRTLSHVANTLTQVGEERLTTQLFHLVVEQDAFQMSG